MCASNKEPLCASNIHFAVHSYIYFTGCKTGSPLRIYRKPWGSDVHQLDCSSTGRHVIPQDVCSLYALSQAPRALHRTHGTRILSTSQVAGVLSQGTCNLS